MTIARGGKKRYKETKLELQYLLSETMQARKRVTIWSDNFKVLKENYQLRILYQQKYLSKMTPSKSYFKEKGGRIHCFEICALRKFSEKFSAGRKIIPGGNLDLQKQIKPSNNGWT